MALWLILGIGCIAAGLMTIGGVYLLYPRWTEQQVRADLGIALVTLSVFSFAVFVLQVLDENRLQREEAHRQKADEVQAEAQRQQSETNSLKLQIAIQQDLTGIDLTKRHLEGLYMRGKILRQAKLSEAHLEGAILPDTTLSEAAIDGTYLEGAILHGATADDAYFADAKMENADLGDITARNSDFSRADLRNADLTGADFAGSQFAGANLEGAKYNSATVWGDGRQRPCPEGVCYVKGLAPGQ